MFSTACWLESILLDGGENGVGGIVSEFRPSRDCGGSGEKVGGVQAGSNLELED